MMITAWLYLFLYIILNTPRVLIGYYLWSIREQTHSWRHGEFIFSVSSNMVDSFKDVDKSIVDESIPERASEGIEKWLAEVSLQITASYRTEMSGKFAILTDESLVWPDKLTRNNLKQNLKFHSVRHRWHYTVTCLVVANVRHNVQCRSLFVALALLMKKQHT